MLMLSPDGRSHVVVLGSDLESMRVQQIVPGNTWQGSRLVQGGNWALLGTTMAPGFDYADYEKGTRALLHSHPGQGSLIDALLPRIIP
jgi:hypothetical protein